MFVKVTFMTFLLLVESQLEQNAMFSIAIFSVILLVLFTAVVDNAVSKTLRFPFDHDTTALPKTATALSIIPVVTIVLRPLRDDVALLIVFCIV